MPEKEMSTVARPAFSTYSLTVCALLTAMSVVLARVLTLIPAETTRISLEALPIVLAGLLCGPIPGALVGFAADLIGCLFSPFGYNPIFCLPPILYGLLAGLCGAMCWRKAPCPGQRWPSSLRRCWAPSCGRAWRWRWYTAARRKRHFSWQSWCPAASSSP